jgi:hypothetical protein
LKSTLQFAKIPTEERMRIQAEVDSVAEDLNAGLADYVAGGFGVATGVNQVAGR